MLSPAQCKNPMRRMSRYLAAVLAVVLLIPVLPARGLEDESGRRFRDVLGSEWYAPAVFEMAEEGMLNGRSDGLYHAAEPVARKEWMVVSVRLAGLSTSVSTDGQPWWRGWSEAAVAAGILAAGEVNPANADRGITRLEAARWLCCALLARMPAASPPWSVDISGVLPTDPEATEDRGILRKDGLELLQTDVTGLPDADLQRIAWLTSSGIMAGAGGLFEPERVMTRAEMAVLMKRFLDWAHTAESEETEPPGTASTDAGLSGITSAEAVPSESTPAQLPDNAPISVEMSGLGRGARYEDGTQVRYEFPVPAGLVLSDGGSVLQFPVCTETGGIGTAHLQLSDATATVRGQCLTITTGASDGPYAVNGRITLWLSQVPASETARAPLADPVPFAAIAGAIFPAWPAAPEPARLVVSARLSAEAVEAGTARRVTLRLAPKAAVSRLETEAALTEGLRYVSSQNLLPEDYVPTLVRVGLPLCMPAGATFLMNPLLGDALSDMLDAARNEGVTGFRLDNAYRSPAQQRALFERRVRINASNPAIADPVADALTRVAYPNGSEHQTGLCMDIFGGGAREGGFAATVQYRWMAANAHRFGLVVRYPEDRQEQTRTMFEPWHIRHLGLQTAMLLRERGLCYEEFRTLMHAQGVLDAGRLHAVTAAPESVVAEVAGTRLLYGLAAMDAAFLTDEGARMEEWSVFDRNDSLMLIATVE